ncbi:MAG: nuclear transport factor 2 family protein [Bacteroidales bacterium]|jgi:ketosteroid isomerase-like protein|nr:nuclear transport factor 2 family protein [Bacteroidales bacterium]
MKKIILPLILLAVTLCGCNNTDPGLLTEEQKQAIISETEVIDAAIADRLINKDAAGAFSYFSEDNFLGFIDNGHLMTDLNSTVSAFTESFARLETVKLEFPERQYSVLSPTLVLSTSSFTEEAVTVNGDTLNLKGAMTGLFQKDADTWKIIHVHQSYFPVNN